MGSRRQFQSQKKNKKHHSSATSAPRPIREPRVLVERAAPVVYGKPFVLLEDPAKNTFIFKMGAWVPYTASIAECRETCKVKELPQRVNQMIRYEVRSPVQEA